MTTLDPKDGYAVLINTFRVAPERAEDDPLGAGDRRDNAVPTGICVGQPASERRPDAHRELRPMAQPGGFRGHAQGPCRTRPLIAAGKIATSFDPVIFELRYSDLAAATR
jgi:hypothetical protein